MVRFLFAIVCVVFGSLAAAPTARQASADPCNIQEVRRVVAVGDVHGAYDEFTRVLRAAGLIDARDQWIGGAAHLVQTGDVLDRGADSKRVLDLLRRLEREASRAGGRVLPLVGNHEVMRMLGDVRDIHPGEVEAFRTAMSIDVRDRVRERWVDERRDQAPRGTPVNERALVEMFDAQTPLGLIEMFDAFSARGEYGRWLRSRPAAVRIDGILFLHGGVSPRIAPLGCAGINEGIRTELTRGWDKFRQAPLEALAGAEDGPLWYRGLAQEDEEKFTGELEKILETLDARAIVVGHTVTPTGRITPRFGGRVVQIDTGMLTRVYQGRPSALEIAGDDWTAVYEDGRQPIRTPAVAARATAR